MAMKQTTRHHGSLRSLTLESMPDDILIQIFELLDTVDIVALRAVCTKVAAATRLGTVWRTALRHCVSRAIPIPGMGTSCPIPAGELEWRTRRAVYLEKLWTFQNSSPFTFRTYRFNAHASGIDQIYLVPGGRCLLTRRGSRLMCWDLGLKSAREVEYIDEWRYVHGWVSTCVVDDQEPTNLTLAVGALEINKPTVILQVTPLDSNQDVFTELGTIQTIGRPVAMRGDILVVYNVHAVRDDEGIGIHLINWRHGGTKALRPQDATMGVFMDVTFHLDLLVVVYNWGIELWTISSIESELLQRFSIGCAMRGPIVFTTCLPRTLAQEKIKTTPQDSCVFNDDIGISRTGLKDYPTLTILSSNRPASDHGVSQIMLQQISESALPVHFPNAPHLHHILHFHLVRAMTADIPEPVSIIKVGPSGRGIYLSNSTLFAFKPISIPSPFGYIKGTPDLEHPKPVNYSQGVLSEWTIARQVLAFDDGMGRIVVGNEYGAVAVLDCIRT